MQSIDIHSIWFLFSWKYILTGPGDCLDNVLISYCNLLHFHPYSMLQFYWILLHVFKWTEWVWMVFATILAKLRQDK